MLSWPHVNEVVTNNLTGTATVIYCNWNEKQKLWTNLIHGWLIKSLQGATVVVMHNGPDEIGKKKKTKQAMLSQQPLCLREVC